LPKNTRLKVIESYVAMEVSNKNVERFHERTNLGVNTITWEYASGQRAVKDDLKETLKKIVRALNELRKIHKI
ncbi:MAG TPA: hypothetical protein VGD05_14335, partial [Pyrinomonadaceae bacterium]